MKKIRCALLYLILLVSGLQSGTASAQDIVKNDLSGTDYFAQFDYTDPEGKDEVFAFERQLVEQALFVEDYLAKNPQYEPLNRKQSSRQKLAMTLVYTGMLVMNNNNGAKEGHYTLTDLTSQLKLSAESTLQAELAARFDLATRLLQLARATAPEDDRIDSWLAAITMHRQQNAENKVDEKTLDWIVDNAVRDPMFHLFSALTMNSDFEFGREREAKLLEKVEWLNSKESPCRKLFFRTGEAKKCNTTKKTPFAFQGVTVYMGDSYLKESARLYSTDPELSKKFADKAKKLYTRVDWFIFKPKARKWNKIGLLPERKKMADDLMAGNNTSTGYFQTRRYLDIYTCTSCHQNGVAKDKLHLRLPEPSNSFR